MKKKKYTQDQRIGKLEKAVGELYFFLQIAMEKLDELQKNERTSN